MTRSIHTTRRFALSAAACAAIAGAGLLGSSAALAQAFPTKPVTIDILARIIGQALTTELGQSVIVDNRAGAGGNIGGSMAAKAPADGYTLFMGTVGTHAINASLYKKMPFDPVKDFAPLTRVANVPNLLVANPGQLNCGSSGSGSSIHLSGELFKSLAKVDMVHVPYKGSAPAVTDLLGNQIVIMFDNMPSAIQQVRSGKLVPIAVTTAKRSPELPNVPTIADAGVAGYEATSWFGMFAPAGTPAPVLAKLNTALVKVLNQADVKKKINDQGAEAMSETPAQFAAFIQAESVKWGKVVKESGASLD